MVRRRARWITAGGAALGALLTSCGGAKGLDGTSTCVEFIHADRAARAEAIHAALEDARHSPVGPVVPSVDEVSWMCDARPTMTVAQAMGAAVTQRG